YIGFDIHKRYTFYTQMNETGVIQRQGKLSNTREALGEFFADVTEPARVAMEATMNWYHLFDLLEVLEIPVTLAHPERTRAIAEAKVKTDKVDSTILAHLLRADLVPAAYIPPREGSARAAAVPGRAGAAADHGKEPDPCDPAQARISESSHRCLWPKGPGLAGDPVSASGVPASLAELPGGPRDAADPDQGRVGNDRCAGEDQSRGPSTVPTARHRTLQRAAHPGRDRRCRPLPWP
ncbi:MAG: transposase, partial [Candidatus Kerfeldbacteria bacterium]|nr:transposase [Candidatus Kerfeldbacteria bacterium]